MHAPLLEEITVTSLHGAAFYVFEASVCKKQEIMNEFIWCML